MKPQTRIPEFDNLRAILILLCIAVHCAFYLFVFKSAESGIHWGFNAHLPIRLISQLRHYFFLPIFYILTFLMPTFFFLAGFFAHKSYKNHGGRYLIKSRIIRIGYPFLFFVAFVILTYTLQVFMIAHIKNQSFLIAFNQNYQSGIFKKNVNNLDHFWYLYYLIYTYIFLAALKILQSKFSKIQHLFQLFKLVIHKTIQSAKFFYGMIVITTILLMVSDSWYLITDESFKPSLALLIFYSIWFFIGWIINSEKKSLEHFKENAWIKLGISFLLYNINFVAYKSFFTDGDMIHHFAIALLCACYITLATSAIIGLGLRYLSFQNSIFSYISQASYWTYLVHIPIIYYFMPIFIISIQSIYLVFFSCLLTAIVLSILTYQLFVRHTVLNKIVG